jgi:hypothetical protein
MADLSLTDKEIELMQKSITHCIATCHKGGAKDGCTDCIALEALLKKLSK